MPFLEKLRSKGALFVAILLGLALLSFVLTDFLTPGRSLFSNDERMVATINGEKVDYIDFMKRLEARTQMTQAMQGNRIDERMSEYIREQVWQDYLREYLFDPTCEKLGIVVTSDELSERIIGDDPHPMVRQSFTNPQDNSFDKARVVEFLQRLDDGVDPTQRAYWLQMEREIAQDLKAQKFATAVARALYVTDLELNLQRELNADQREMVYLQLPMATIPDSTVKITDADLRAYYEKNHERFRREETRDIVFARFPIKPSNDDRNSAREWVEQYATDFETTNEPGIYASQNGDRQYLGSWVALSDVEEPLREWAMQAKVDECSPTIEENEEVIKARVVGRKTLPDSVSARHILLAAQQYDATRANQLADSLIDRINKGDIFDSLAVKFSDDPGSAQKGGDLGWFGHGTMVKPFADACFNSKPGAVVKVESQFGTHIIKVEKQGGASERIDIAVLARRIEPSSQTHQQTYGTANAFAQAARLTAPGWWSRTFANPYPERAQEADILFDSLTAKYSVQKELSPTTPAQASRLSSLEQAREVVRWAFQNKPGDVSTVFEADGNFIVAMVRRINASEDGYATFEAVRDELLGAVTREAKLDTAAARLNKAAKASEPIETIASTLGQGVRRASSITYNGYAFGGEGYEPALVGAASALQPGQRFQPAKGNVGVYLISCEAAEPNPNAPALDRDNLNANQRARVQYSAYDALIRMAKITDRRAQFF